MAAIDDLIQQIKSQGTTSQWSGGFGAEDAAKDMARILDSIGITDIRQFGKVPTYESVVEIGKSYNGKNLLMSGPDEDGKGGGEYFYDEPTGRTIRGFDDFGEIDVPEIGKVKVPEGAKLDSVYGVINPQWQSFDSPSSQFSSIVSESDVVKKDGQLVAKTGETFGNKATGQAVPNTYSERQTGNAWGGTFAGKGNTGYRVDFTPDGTPVFYTTGASSSELKDYAPLLAIAGLAIGAPMLGEALAGLGAGATELGALSALDAGMGVYGASGLGAGTGLLGGAEALSALDAGMGVYPTLGISEAVGGTALSGLDAGMGAYPSTGNIGAEGLSALDAGMDVYPSTGTIGDAAAATAAKSALSVSDAIRLAGIGATLAGGAKLASGAGGSGSGGYDIVPIPSDWTSPPPTSVAEFTPLPDIDFGNKEMLRGTQWERLLNPNYGNVPAPTQYAQPSNISYDELTRILGGSKTSMPTQSLTINDVISGIQNQYGQAPKGAVG